MRKEKNISDKSIKIKNITYIKLEILQKKKGYAI